MQPWQQGEKQNKIVKNSVERNAQSKAEEGDAPAIPYLFQNP
jgi:hypothetical protein